MRTINSEDLRRFTEEGFFRVVPSNPVCALCRHPIPGHTHVPECPLAPDNALSETPNLSDACKCDELRRLRVLYRGAGIDLERATLHQYCLSLILAQRQQEGRKR